METIFDSHEEDSGVYKITNTVNGKIYIGSCANFRHRAKIHSSTLDKRSHHNIHLQHSYHKHGSDAFLFEIIEVVNGKQLNRTLREQYYIDQQVNNWNQCFNIQKKVIRKQGPWSFTPEETRKKIGLAHKGKIVSYETRNKLSVAQLGKTQSIDCVRRRVEAVMNSPKLNRGCSFISPLGKVVVERNVAEFSRKFALEASLLRRLHNAKTGCVHHKGWSVGGIDIHFFLSPKNELYGTYNLSAFAKHMNLKKSGIGKIKNGHLNAYRGWSYATTKRNTELGQGNKYARAYKRWNEIYETID